MTSTDETTGQADPKQFTTRYLFSLTAAVAVALVPIAAWRFYGVPLALWLLIVGVSIINRRFQVAAWTFALGLLVTLLIIPAVGSARPSARRSACMNNMQQISLALINYESANGHFPPPYTTDDDGNPLHSWRVLILPYLEENELYGQINLNKPWHDPENLTLADRMPGVYCCPAERNFSPYDDHTTAYVAIIGERTVWRPSKQTSGSDLLDGASQTLLILESEVYRLHWMSTADPTYEMLGPRNSSGDSLLKGGPHNGVSVATFCDCHTACLSESESFTAIRDLATIDGGEPIPNKRLAK